MKPLLLKSILKCLLKNNLLRQRQITKTFRGTYFRYASLDIHCNALEKFLENTIEVQISSKLYLKRMPLSGDNFSTYVTAYFRCAFYFSLITFFIYVSKMTGYDCIA